MSKQEISTIDSDQMEVVPVVSRQTLAQIVVEAATMAETMKQVKSIALSVTNKDDWSDLNGPYLEATGTEKVARLFRVQWQPVGPPDYEVFEDADGQYFQYTYYVKSWMGDGTDAVTGMGVCSSRDKFFGTVGGSLKQIHEVNRGNIKQKALTNAEQNSIKRLLGLRNLSWDEVNQFVPDAAADKGYDFDTKQGKKKTESRMTDTGKSAKMEKPELIAGIKSMVEEIFADMPDAIPGALQEWLTYKDSKGPNSFDGLENLAQGRLYYAHRDIQKRHKEFLVARP